MKTEVLEKAKELENQIILLEKEKLYFKNPRWIGWNLLEINKYNKKDQSYLKKLKNELNIF